MMEKNKMNEYCTKCGNKANENEVYCIDCGVKINPVDIKSKYPHHGQSMSQATYYNAARKTLNLKDAVSVFSKYGDSAAFTDIYNHTYRKVSIAANTYMKNHADAEDAIQETYIKVYNKINTIQDNEKILPWIMTITRFTCLDKLEKRKRTEVTRFEDENNESIFENIKDERTGSSPESNFFQKEHSSIILEMVANLPLEQKDTVMLHYIEQYSVFDVAAMTNTTTGTVKSRLNYARKKLKEMVLEREKQGVKLRIGGLFIFLPFFLRRFVQTAPLSSEIAGASLTTIEVTLGISTSAGVTTKATAITGSVLSAISAKVMVAAVLTVTVVIGSTISLPFVLPLLFESNNYIIDLDNERDRRIRTAPTLPSAPIQRPIQNPEKTPELTPDFVTPPPSSQPQENRELIQFDNFNEVTLAAGE